MSINRVITKKCECLVVNWQRALCYHMQWCREVNLWRSTLYNVETVFHEVPTNQPHPQIITWVLLKHYSSFFFFSQNSLVYESYYCWRADCGIKGRSSGSAAQFPSPSFCLALFTLILTVEPGPRLLDTGRIVLCLLELHYVNDDDIITSSCWVLLGHMLHRGPSSCEIHHPSVRKIGPYTNQDLFNFVAPNYKWIVSVWSNVSLNLQWLSSTAV